MTDKPKRTRRTAATGETPAKRRAPARRKSTKVQEGSETELPLLDVPAEVSPVTPAEDFRPSDAGPSEPVDLPDTEGGVYSFSPDDDPAPASEAAPQPPPVEASEPVVEAAPVEAQEATQSDVTDQSVESEGSPESDPTGTAPEHPGEGGRSPWYGKGYWKERKKLKKAQKFFERRFGKQAPPVLGAEGIPPIEAPVAEGTAPVAGQAPAAPTATGPALHASPHAHRDRDRERGRGRDRGGRGDRGDYERSSEPVRIDTSRFADADALVELAATLWTAESGDAIRLNEIEAMNTGQLAEQCRALGLTPSYPLNRRALFQEILKAAADQKRLILNRGILDISPDGNGFILHSFQNYRIDGQSTFVPESVIRKFGLKRGHEIEAQVQSPQGTESCPVALVIREVMGLDPETAKKVTAFEDLVPYYPLKRILLENPEVTKDVSMRTVDLLTPVGFGQRGLIVAPPRTGKTVLMQNVANSITRNHPDAILIVLLVDERPEEVTDFRRTVKGEVVSSTFDESAESHVHLAEVVSEKARRLVEMGKHVVILLDSITRLARAYNTLASNSGKIMTGGIEASALQKPKRFFGAARNIEDGGSLTILGTALVETGSKMDEVIFEEFKGTGNMELHLDRSLVEKRIFPALNIEKSGTRKEELIYHPEEMVRIHSLRRAMQGVPPPEAMEMLLTRLKKTKTNAEFLMSINR
jgi:transcription termination factor Rho